MKTDKEIKKEFSVWCSVHSNSIGRLQEIDSSNISDFWLSKFHTLQEEYKKELIDKIEKLYQDEHPVDCIDGETPVETYGYEETHNEALKSVINIIKQ